MLQGKTAIAYGAGGSIGSALARTFAAEGAVVHLVGRTDVAARAAPASPDSARR